MKTLILYATKYGATLEAVKRLATHFEDVCIHDMKQEATPPLSEFECIIIGSSIYAGSIRKEAKIFMQKNADVILTKKYGLFICGMSKIVDEGFLGKNFPLRLLGSAKAKSMFGGIYDPQKVGGFERFIMKMIIRQPGIVDTINNSKIEQFAKQMKE